jgi:hypothetical protein
MFASTVLAPMTEKPQGCCPDHTGENSEEGGLNQYGPTVTGCLQNTG